MWPGPAPLARRAGSTIVYNTGDHGRAACALARARGRTYGGSTRRHAGPATFCMRL